MPPILSTLFYESLKQGETGGTCLCMSYEQQHRNDTRTPGNRDGHGHFREARSQSGVDQRQGRVRVGYGRVGRARRGSGYQAALLLLQPALVLLHLLLLPDQPLLHEVCR